MPQAKKLDFSDLGAKPVMDFSDLGAKPVQAVQTAAPPPLPNPIAGLAADINKEAAKPTSYNPVATDLLAGAGSGVFSTGLGISKLFNRATGGRVGHDPATKLESVPLFGKNYDFSPQNTTQKVGMAGEQIAEVAVPATKASSLIKGPGWLRAAARTGAEGATVGAVRAAQTGDPVQGAKEGTAAAALGGGVRLVGAGLRASLLSAPKIHRWLGVAPKELEHGANPGQQLLSEKLLGATKEATKANVDGALTGAGTDLAAALKTATAAGKTIDGDTIVQKALVDATKTIGLRSDTAFQSRLTGILDDIVATTPVSKNMTPEQAHALKKQIGDAIKWHGAPYEGDLNEVLLQMYRGLNEGLKSAGNNIGPLQRRWGNLYLASKSLKAGMTKDLAGQGTGSLAGTVAKDVGKKAVGVGLASGGVLGARAILD